jgi:hypothetical protein
MELEFEDYYIDAPDDATDEELLALLSEMPAFSENDRWGYVGGGDIVTGPNQLPPPKYVVDPKLERSALLPIGYRDGTPEWALPEFAADAAQGAYNLGGALAGIHSLPEEQAMESAIMGGAPAMLPQVAAKPTPGTVRSFIGKSGKEWDQQARNTALYKEAMGEDPTQIFRETGMFKAPDGEWKMYKPNKEFFTKTDTRLDSSISSKKDGEFFLKDILPADDPIRSNYGDQGFDDIVVKFEYMPDYKPNESTGYYSPGIGMIVVRGNNPLAVKNALIHEAQHAIQKKEGDVFGTVPENFYQRHLTADDVKRKSDIQGIMKEIGFQWDETETANGNVGALKDAYKEHLMKLFEKDPEAARAKAPNYHLLDDELTDLISTWKEKPHPFTLYQTNMGEAEARLAEATSRGIDEFESPMDYLDVEITDLHPERSHEGAYLRYTKARDAGEDVDYSLPATFGEL